MVPEPVAGASPWSPSQRCPHCHQRGDTPGSVPHAGTVPSLTRGRRTAPTAGGKALRRDRGCSPPVRGGFGRLLGRAQGSHDSQNPTENPGQPLHEQWGVRGTCLSLPIHPSIFLTYQQRCHPCRGHSPDTSITSFPGGWGHQRHRSPSELWVMLFRLCSPSSSSLLPRCETGVGDVPKNLPRAAGTAP